MPRGEVAAARIPVTPRTLRRIKDVSAGAGMTYDELLNMLVDAIQKHGEAEVITGVRLREQIKKVADANLKTDGPEFNKRVVQVVAHIPESE